MKRLKVWLLTCLLLLTLAACGGETEEAPELPEEEIEEQLPEAPVTEEEPPAEDPVEETPEETPEEPPAEEKPAAGEGSSSTTIKIPEPHKTYYFRINLKTCTVNVYTKDENGAFTVPHKAMVCSTGYATPKSGVYRIGNIWEWLRLKDNVYGHYVTQITGNILFHSVPYLKWGDPGSLEYWEFDKLGTKASQGCIRLQVSDAIWVYNNGRDIAGVEFYSDDDPGPFGKPAAPKISDNELCRNWDPTDPDPANPWHSYVAGEEDVTEEIDPETGLPIVPEGDETAPEDGEVTGEETTPGKEGSVDVENVPENPPADTETVPEGDGSDSETTPEGEGENTGEAPPQGTDGETAETA